MKRVQFHLLMTLAQQTAIPWEEYNSTNSGHTIRLPGMDSRLLLKRITLVEEIPIFLPESSTGGLSTKAHSRCPQLMHNTSVGVYDTVTTTPVPFHTSAPYDYTADTTFGSHEPSEGYLPPSTPYSCIYPQPFSDSCLMASSRDLIFRDEPNHFLQPVSIPSHSSQTTLQQFPFIFQNIYNDDPEPSAAAASLLAILNGSTQDTSLSAIPTPTPYDRISSIDDPPIARPTPIGAETRLLRFVPGESVPPWPPILSGLTR